MVINEELILGMAREEKGLSDEAHTARSVGSGTLAVLATPAMIALMEKAAANLAEDFLPEGWTSVGVSMNVKHTSATPLGMGIRAVAEVIEAGGRGIKFSVVAFDDAGEIGRGVHERVAVEPEKFMEKAAMKRASEAAVS